MKRMLIAAAAIAVASASSIDASLLGERYGEISVGYTNLNPVDGLGTSAGVNLPVLQNDAGGVDISFGGSWSQLEAGSWVELDEYSAGATVLPYFELSDVVTLATMVGAGWIWQDIEGWGSEDTLYGELGLGLEFNATADLSFLLGASWTKFEAGGDSWTASLSTNYWVNEMLGIGLFYSADIEEPDDNYSVGATARLRF